MYAVLVCLTLEGQTVNNSGLWCFEAIGNGEHMLYNGELDLQVLVRR
jgi:hypothetical protein